MTEEQLSRLNKLFARQKTLTSDLNKLAYFKTANSYLYLNDINQKIQLTDEVKHEVVCYMEDIISNQLESISREINAINLVTTNTF